MTIIEHIKKGNTIKGLSETAAGEYVSEETLRAGITDGVIVIAKNNHRDIPLLAIGKGMSTKVNANIGTSSNRECRDDELEKLRIAEKYGAHTVMDLSTGPDLIEMRRQILDRALVPVGTVPVYQAAALCRHKGLAFTELTADELIAPIRLQAEEGVDFMTIHAGITTGLLSRLSEQKRLLGIVSRGGALLAQWMRHHQQENPYFSKFDEILEICRDHDVTVSLGDGLRPGCIEDANDASQIDELITIGSLVKRCRDADVQVIVEGPGHMALNLIEGNVQLMKKLCHGVPYYVLGPLTTDIAPGYDHITSAIGGAAAAASGVDFLCYVTPSEHLRLPDGEDVRRGVIAARIAAHSGDIVKGAGNARHADYEVSKSRAALDWDTQLKYVLDPDRCLELREISENESLHPCSMCGELCTYKINPEDRKG